MSYALLSSQSSLDRSVGQLVAERPERAALFEKFGIDYCCRGHYCLREACLLCRVDPREVLMGLSRLDSMTPAGSERDWTAATLPALIEHIVEKRHGYLRDALPRISYLINKVWDAHAQHHPELSDVASVFSVFRNRMEQHMAKEEQTLFPLCLSLYTSTAAATGRGMALPDLVATLDEEHAAVAEALKSLRKLTNGYTPPEDGCPTYRVMLNSLAEMDEETRRHVYEEDHVLVPRALALVKSSK